MMRAIYRYCSFLGLLLIGTGVSYGADRGAISLSGETSGEEMLFLRPPGWEEAPSTGSRRNIVFNAKSAAGVPLAVLYGVATLPKEATPQEFLEACLGNSCKECEDVVSSQILSVSKDPSLPQAQRAVGCTQVKGKNYGYVSIWRVSLRGKDVFYSRYTWLLPPFDGKREWPVSQQEMKDTNSIGSFFVCDFQGQKTKCPDVVSAIAGASSN